MKSLGEQRKIIEKITERDKAITDIKDKALLVIEHLCCGDFKPSDKVLEACYTFAHVGRGVCENPHEDWVEELEQAFQRIIE